MDLLRDDVPFYRALAAEDPAGLVLELGCGTGRVLIPIARDRAAGAAAFDARRGLDASLEAGLVIGLDLSAAMLGEAARKLALEAPAVRARARLVRGDLERFALARGASLAIVAFRTLINLPTQEAQIHALRAIREALAPGGRAVVDLFHPDLGFLATDVETPREVAHYTDPRDGAACRLVQRARFDPVAQTLDDVLERTLTHPDGRVETRIFRNRYRFPYAEEMRLMCAVAGLAVERVMGWFDGRPLDAGSREMIFVLRRG